jgi:hypothetical protein
MALTIRQMTSCLLSLAGAVVGGVLGYYIFRWFLRYNFYGMMIPGALVGLGCGLLAQHSSPIRGLVCALVALGLGFYTEWSFFPFADDRSLGFFLKNITALSPVTFLMIALGAFFAYWLGKDAGFQRLSGGGRLTTPRQHQNPPPSN